MILARKINNIPEFYMIFARILNNNCPKNIFPFFGVGTGHVPSGCYSIEECMKCEL